MFDGVKAPRLIAEINFTKNPAVDASLSPYLRLDSAATPLDTGTLGDVELWEEVTEDVTALSVRIGRSKEFDKVEPGTATVTLDNSAGTYDPVNIHSPFYEAGAGSSILPMRQIQLRAVWKDVTYPLFRGYVQNFNFDFGNDPSVVLDCVDAASMLAAITLPEITPAFGGELTSDRINRLLDVAQFPTSLRKIEVGKTVMPNTQYNDNIWNLLQEAAEAENGLCVVDQSGAVRFFNRDHIYTDPRSITPQALLTDTS